MATETATATDVSTGTDEWKAGMVGGLAGGLVFGALMSMMMPHIVETAIPGMYGLPASGTVGWGIHMAHSAVLGVVFAGIVGLRPELGASTGRSVGVGVAYGVVLWVVLATFVMPAWVGAMTPMSPPVPDVNPMSLVGHVVYGAVLGGVYAAVGN
ncbi:histidine kinase [Halorubrum sp. JWXQ-INN 858]|uniref:histidine kinase n=1 Tax=Halorubrum sp. JWXQ-INN 858 TaxID=2690782 RepID=UPI001356ACBC|nr:histidine kinase [Halorubrum sp. JWXQ-INN 858]MWV63584.1 histidine kinase [Halorubrum sp. JWXQ-INN 858]